MGFYNLDRLAISDKYCLRIAKPSGVKRFSSDKSANGGSTTTVALKMKNIINNQAVKNIHHEMDRNDQKLCLRFCHLKL